MRHQARTRRGGGIPPTKHRDANGGCSAREESSFSQKRATNMRRLGPAPEGATRGHGRGLAERTEAGGGELCRTRPRSRICIRRAGRRTHKSPALHREHGCPDRDRMLEGKPAQSGDESANYSAKQISTGSKIEPNTTHKLQVLSKSNGSLRLAPGRSATKRGSARPPIRSAQ